MLREAKHKTDSRIDSESERLVLKSGIRLFESAFEKIANSSKILFLVGLGLLVYFLYKFFSEEGFVYMHNGIQKVMSFHDPASAIPAILFFAILFLFAFVFTKAMGAGLKLLQFIIRQVESKKNL